MRRVSRDEFFAVIGPLNVHPSVRGNYHDDDYGADWKTPGGLVVGRTIERGPTPHHKPNTDYFLSDAPSQFTGSGR